MNLLFYPPLNDSNISPPLCTIFLKKKKKIITSGNRILIASRFSINLNSISRVHIELDPWSRASIPKQIRIREFAYCISVQREKWGQGEESNFLKTIWQQIFQRSNRGGEWELVFVRKPRLVTSYVHTRTREYVLRVSPDRISRYLCARIARCLR